MFWLLYWLVNYINPPEPFKKVATVVLAVLAVLGYRHPAFLVSGQPLLLEVMKAASVNIDSIHIDPANLAHASGPGNLDTIKASLARFGQQKPIVVDGNGICRAGNGTLEAARRSAGRRSRSSRHRFMGSGGHRLRHCRQPHGRTSLRVGRRPLRRDTESSSSSKISTSMTSGLARMNFQTSSSARNSTANRMADDPALQIDRGGRASREVGHRIGGQLWEIGRHRLPWRGFDPGRGRATCDGRREGRICASHRHPMTQQGIMRARRGDWMTLMGRAFGNLPMADAGQVLVNLGLVRSCGCARMGFPIGMDGFQWMRESRGWAKWSGWYVWDQGAGLPGGLALDDLLIRMNLFSSISTGKAWKPFY